MNTKIILGFRFVLLFSLVVTFLHSCSENFSITIARNAWVDYFVCLCYGGQELCCVMDGGGNNCIEESLWNGRRKVSIRRNTKEKGVVLLGGLL